jgi:hypothetical protein
MHFNRTELNDAKAAKEMYELQETLGMENIFKIFSMK